MKTFTAISKEGRFKYSYTHSNNFNSISRPINTYTRLVTGSVFENTLDRNFFSPFPKNSQSYTIVFGNSQVGGRRRFFWLKHTSYPFGGYIPQFHFNFRYVTLDTSSDRARPVSRSQHRRAVAGIENVHTDTD